MDDPIIPDAVRTWPVTVTGTESDQRAVEEIRAFYGGPPPATEGDQAAVGRLAYGTDVPFLLAYLDHQAGEVARLRAALADLLDAAGPCEHERGRCVAHNYERLPCAYAEARAALRRGVAGEGASPPSERRLE